MKRNDLIDKFYTIYLRLKAQTDTIIICSVAILIILYFAVHYQEAINRCNTYWIEYINNTGCLANRLDRPDLFNTTINYTLTGWLK